MKSFVEEAYRLFEDAYHYFNNRLFDNALPGCLITFQRQPRLMGYVAFKRWVNTEGKTIDELAINPAYFANYPVTTILQTLCHEMAHIWQEYFGHPSRAGYHNSEWAEKMIRIGLMPSTTGVEGGATVGQTMSDYIIEGGAFEQACSDLLASGFQVRWFDTVQMPPPKKFVSRKIENNVVPLSRSKKPSLLTEDPAYENFPLNLAEVAQQYEQQLQKERSQSHLTPIQTSKAHSKSNRHKYVCPNCFMQVWGKPSLRLMCLDCSQALMEEY